MLIRARLLESQSGVAALRPGFSRPHRAGFSLLEVLTALAIFLISLVGLGQLLSQSAERAQDAHQLGQAALLCQAKLAEVNAGAISLTSQGLSACEEDPDFQWSIDCNSSSTAGIQEVQVHVRRTRADGTKIECTLSQFILDPAQRGSTADSPSSSGSNGSTSGTTGASQTGSQP